MTSSNFPPCWCIRSRPIDYFFQPMAFRPPVLGRHFKVYCMIYTFCRSELLQYSTCLGLRASLAATCIQSIQLFDLERTGFLRHCFSGDSQSILRGPYFVPFKCGVLATAWICWHCHRQILPAIITTLQPHTIRFLHRSNLFRVISGALEFIQSSFSAQVPCILLCVLCARLPTCGFLVLSAALEPLFGSSTLDSSR